MKINFEIPKVVVGILIGIASTFVFILTYLKVTTDKVTEPTILIPTPVAAIPTVLPTTTTDSSDFGKLTWNSAPKKIANPPIINTNSSPDNFSYSFADLGSYEVANFSSGAKLLVSFIVPEGPSSPTPFRIISQNGQYYLIESLISDDYFKKNIDKIFDLNKIKLISYQIKDLFPDDYINNLNQTSFNRFKNGFGLSSFYPQLKNPQVFAPTQFGDMLVTYTPVSDFKDISARTFFLKLHDFTLEYYSQVPPVGASLDKVPSFRLLDNSNNTSQFIQLNVGCGGDWYTTVITNRSILDSKVVVGHGYQSDVYQITSIDSPLVKYLYDRYKTGRDYPSAPPVLSLEQFAKVNNHIIYQEKNGDWALLTNPQYSVQAECGKPVIYLYPSKDSQVTVKVGANVTKSEPLYPQTGWTVLAHPNGQLDYQNHSYPNLFWEGTGYGLYNSHLGEGFVVPQSKLISTIISQLKQQGLNTQEIGDFMYFWKQKLPTSPYVRLTWLNTSDMNQLAPLSVSPMPKTTIRTFLEFGGLQKPIILTPQKFTAPNRDGFTLVEWGGLLLK